MNAMATGPQIAAAQIRVRLELPAGAPPADILSPAIEHAVLRTCEELGIPGQVAIEISVAGVAEPVSLLRFWVNGTRVRFPKTLLSFAHSYLSGSLPEPAATAIGWYENALRQDPSAAAALVEFVCIASLKTAPSVLFAEPAAGLYAESLELVEPRLVPLDPKWLGRIVRPLLDTGITIRDTAAIASTLVELSGHPITELQQELIDRLATQVVEIRMPGALLRELTASEGSRASMGIQAARDRCFGELGLTLPAISLVRDDELPQRTFAFKINDLATEPMVALPPERLFLSDTAERLASFGIQASPTLHPETWQPASTIHETDRNQAEITGWTVLDASAHLRLCLEETLRSQADRLATLRFTRASLDSLSRYWPMTVKAARNEVGDHDLAALLQALVGEGVSIHDLAAILERIIDREYCATAAVMAIVLDDEPAPGSALRGEGTERLVEFVRSGLRRQISAQLARQSSTLIVYLLDGEIEEMLGHDLSDGDEERILSGIRQEIAQLPATVRTPDLMTSSAVRRAARRLVAREFPRMSVIAHEELAPEINVMPIARISPASGSQ